MNRNRTTTHGKIRKPFGRDFGLGLTLAGVLLIGGWLVTVALAGPGSVAEAEPAQAADPPPIGVEMYTPRSEFSDNISFDLTIGLQDGETIEMSITEPGLSAVAKITVQPGAMFPWHTHAGPVLVNIAQGELVYIPANDCIERHYPTGSVFFDPGRGNVHTAYNAADQETILIATFFEVPADGPLTITEGITAPESCDIEVGLHAH